MCLPRCRGADVCWRRSRCRRRLSGGPVWVQPAGAAGDKPGGATAGAGCCCQGPCPGQITIHYPICPWVRIPPSPLSVVIFCFLRAVCCLLLNKIGPSGPLGTRRSWSPAAKLTFRFSAADDTWVLSLVWGSFRLDNSRVPWPEVWHGQYRRRLMLFSNPLHDSCRQQSISCLGYSENQPPWVMLQQARSTALLQPITPRHGALVHVRLVVFASNIMQYFYFSTLSATVTQAGQGSVWFVLLCAIHMLCQLQLTQSRHWLVRSWGGRG